MKKVIILFLCLCFVFCSCTTGEVKNTEKQQITINLPKDNTVNGYRKDENSMPDKIAASEVLPDTNYSNYSYCGNKNSKKFHKASCSALKNTKDTNKIYYKTKVEFIENGYVACKLCNP